MVQGLFPDPGHDGEEPDGFPLPPAAQEDGPAEDGPAEDGLAEDGPALGQGLYVCLPAEQVTLAGFAQDGEADTMAPGPLLAALVDTVTGPVGAGLGGCSDDQLMGIISAGRRMAARAEWTSLAAIAEYAAPAQGLPADRCVRRRGAGLRAAPDPAVGRGADGLCVGGRRPAAPDVRRAGRWADPPGARADHRGRDQRPVC